MIYTVNINIFSCFCDIQAWILFEITKNILQHFPAVRDRAQSRNKWTLTVLVLFFLLVMVEKVRRGAERVLWQIVRCNPRFRFNKGCLWVGGGGGRRWMLVVLDERDGLRSASVLNSWRDRRRKRRPQIIAFRCTERAARTNSVLSTY